jgi:hypothetical protein
VDAGVGKAALEEKENQNDDQDQENDSATYVHRNPLSFARMGLPVPAGEEKSTSP